jgi:hypothetical protein
VAAVALAGLAGRAALEGGVPEEAGWVGWVAAVGAGGALGVEVGVGVTATARRVGAGVPKTLLVPVVVPVNPHHTPATASASRAAPICNRRHCCHCCRHCCR